MTWPPDWKKLSLARVKESVADLVWVRQLDEDTAVEGCAIRRSLAKKLDKCVGPSVNFRGWDNRTVEIDSFVNMCVTWEGRKTMVERVATVKHPPFSVILGVDWIIASKTDLIVQEEKLVPVSQPKTAEAFTTGTTRLFPTKTGFLISKND
jgi:hypothetical protein